MDDKKETSVKVLNPAVARQIAAAQAKVARFEYSHELECASCGEVWKYSDRGSLPKDYYRCPNGCLS